MKRQGLILIAVLITILLSYSFSFAQSQQITNGLNYLVSTQNPDGSWLGTVNRGDLATTVNAIETLSLLGQQNNQSYSNALLWLQAQSLEATEQLAVRIYTLSAAGTDQDLLISYFDNASYAWAGDNSPDVDILDTALALSALKKINYSDQNTINSALNYLLSNQNSDGGFGFYSGDDSNVYMSALVSSTLQQFPQTTSIASAINKATAYLISKQNSDGGFGVDPVTGEANSTTYETALAVIALINGNTGQVSNLPLQQAIQNAIIYIETTQLSNGSWNDDPYSTALALRALASIKPNLSISSSDITFSNTTPTIGDTITISANINNTGPAQAP